VSSRGALCARFEEPNTKVRTARDLGAGRRCTLLETLERALPRVSIGFLPSRAALIPSGIPRLARARCAHRERLCAPHRSSNLAGRLATAAPSVMVDGSSVSAPISAVRRTLPSARLRWAPRRCSSQLAGNSSQGGRPCTTSMSPRSPSTLTSHDPSAWRRALMARRWLPTRTLWTFSSGHQGGSTGSR
jgi:hypothetical protein